MALVDFYQLAILYKLRRQDAGFPHSHSFSMSDTSPSLSPPPPSSPVQPDQVHPPLPPTQPEFKTPERKRVATRSLQQEGVTPLSRGSSIRQRQEGDTDRVDKYNCDDYESYVREDLKSRVFVDFEVFMKNVLHVPDDWETRWRSVIEAVKADTDFNQHHTNYCGLCATRSTVEEPFYKPLTDTANAVLKVLAESEFDGVSSGIPQRYCVVKEKRLQGGIFNKTGLSPDVIALHDDYNCSNMEDLHWANPLHVLEVKPFDSVICDGRDMPKLVVNGQLSNEIFPCLTITEMGTRSRSDRKPCKPSQTITIRKEEVWAPYRFHNHLPVDFSIRVHSIRAQKTACESVVHSGPADEEESQGWIHFQPGAR